MSDPKSTPRVRGAHRPSRADLEAQGIYTIDGLRRMLAAQPRPTQWGSWIYEPSSFVLRERSGFYEVDLDRCCNSAEILDWIIQIRSKAWATPDLLADLLAAIQAVLRPQQNICGGGVDKTVNPRTVARRNGYKTPPVHQRPDYGVRARA